MNAFVTKRASLAPDAIAPDGSEVRLLCATTGGSMARFTLHPGAVSRAVAHRTVEELWYIVAGCGRMWRKSGKREEVIDLAAGCSLTIPMGTHFQFRCEAGAPLEAVGVTMPPWPGEDEAYAVTGPWAATR